DLEDGARHLLTPLKGLPWIGRGTQRDLGSRIEPCQFLFQQPLRILLVEDVVLEALRCKLHELMGVARIAVAARELAASIWIDGVSKWESAPRGGLREDRARFQRPVLGQVAFGIERRLGC